MRWSSTALASAMVVSGCALSHDVGEPSPALLAPIELSQTCADEVGEAPDKLPKHLECTGLYKNADTQEVADEAQAFTPIYPLWTDAAQKFRWVFLPKGKKIDASDPNAWKFPIGTRLWKEFRNPAGTRKIETRVFVKLGDDDWSYATYLWDDQNTRATRFDSGKELMVDGKRYGLPSHEQCNECHVGRRERVMGFDAVTLGLKGDREGLTLDKLLNSKRLKNYDADSELQVGPDPESNESQALAWMHNNCGVSCHNDNPNSKAYSTGMRLRLDPTQLDGRPTDDFDSIKTTIGKPAFALQWQGQTRIVPGKPEQSLLYTLISQRGDPKQQMPPLGTYYTDDEHTKIVKQWIAGLSPQKSN